MNGSARRLLVASLAVSLAACRGGGDALPPASSSPPAPTPASSAAPAAVASSSTASTVTSPKEYMDRVVPLICAHAVKCSVKMGESGRADCLRGPGPRWSPLWLWGYFGALQADEIDRELRAGRYRFDAQRAAACLAAMENRGCHDAGWSPSCEPVLRAYLAPAVALGGACRRSDSCIEGFCDEEARRAIEHGAASDGGAQEPPTGHCVPFLKEGSKCALDAQCGPHHACGERDDPFGKCVRLPKAGEPCTLTVNQCDDPRFVCAAPGGAPRRCRPFPAQGELCGDPEHSMECQAGLYCEITDPTPRCKSPLPLGAACRTGDACEDGLVCDGLVLDEPSVHTYAGAQKLVKAGQCKAKSP